MAERKLSAVIHIARQFLRDEFAAGQTLEFKEDELKLHAGEALLEVSQRRPRQVKETFTICNRYGEATATTADHLIDTTNAQFVAGDVGKTVYNSTDETTAKVTAYTSASDLTLDTDIMESGESYALYHYEGVSGRDINISSITDLIEVIEAEYPTRQYPRNIKQAEVFGDILTLAGSDFYPSDGDEVFLYCNKVHTLTEATSTLTPELQKVLVDGVVAKASLAWLNKFRDQIVPASLTKYQSWVDRQIALYNSGLVSITKPGGWQL